MTESVKELIPYLDKLADKLDSSAPALWALQIQQAHATFITGIIQYILLAICLLLWFGMFKHFNKKELLYKEQLKDRTISAEEFEAKTTGYTAIPTISMMIMGIYYFWKVPSITELGTIFLNPEYWALQELIKMVKVVGS